MVIASAGYGKSTVLSLWADQLDRPVAWLDLDAGDNDAVRLVRCIVASLTAVGEPETLVDIGRQVRPGTIARALSAVEQALYGIPPFVFVIDDAHLITDQDATDVLDTLIDAVPAGSRLILAARTEPHIHTGRRRVSGQLKSLGSVDLELTSEESNALLRMAAPTADLAVLETLAGQAEGWAAGLQFIALALRGTAVSEFADAPKFAQRELLAKYFQQEFLDSLTPEHRSFLVRTSVLVRLSGELCDHVLAGSGSTEHLDALVTSGNAFVLPIGNSGLFRYHPLFSEVLLADLRSTTPEIEAALRQRAIDWHERRGEWGAAVRTALDSNGGVSTSPLILRYVVPRISAGEVASIGAWLSEYSHQEISADPLLCISSAWFALFTNQPGDMERWLDQAESQEYPGPLPDGTLDLAVASAAVRMVAGTGGVLATAAYARQILDAAPNGGPWSPVALLLEAVSLSCAGGVPNLSELLEQAEFESRGFAPAHAVALAHLALDAFDHRDSGSANSRLRAALDEVDDHGLTHMSQVSLVFCAKALFDARSEDFDESAQAAEHAGTLLTSADSVHVRAHISHNLVLAEAAILRSDWREAERLVKLAEQRLPGEPDAVVLHDWRDRIAARCATRHGLGHMIDLTAAERRVLEQLATHRTLAEIGEHLYVSRNTVKTHTVSIYRKLVVSGRSEAVERAVELGLLDSGQVPSNRAATSAG